MARKNRISLRLNDDEYAIVPDAKTGDREHKDIDFCREAISKYGSLQETAKHYHREIEKLESERASMTTEYQDACASLLDAHGEIENQKSRASSLSVEVLALSDAIVYAKLSLTLKNRKKLAIEEALAYLNATNIVYAERPESEKSEKEKPKGIFGRLIDSLKRN